MEGNKDDFLKVENRIKKKVLKKAIVPSLCTRTTGGIPSSGTINLTDINQFTD